MESFGSFDVQNRLVDCAEEEIQTAFAEGVMRTLVLLYEKGLIKL